MAPSPSASEQLLDLAEESIRGGLAGLPRLVPALDDLHHEVRAPGAAFVTVTVDGELNGCIGTTEATEALGVAVARLAHDAAFADPRLPPLCPDDWPGTAIKISVLGAMVPMDVDSEDELVAALRPGVDGVLLEAGGRRGTFLPAVWDALPDPLDFVRHLQVKAGLRQGLWPSGARVWRYAVDEVGPRQR